MILDYMKKGYRTEYITESYIESPPAAFILDERGNTFTLGFTYQDERDRPKGNYAFNILLNGVDTGEFASHIIKKGNRIIIQNGRIKKIWNGKNFI